MDGTLRRIEAGSDLVAENVLLRTMVEPVPKDNIDQINQHLKVLAINFPDSPFSVLIGRAVQKQPKPLEKAVAGVVQ